MPSPGCDTSPLTPVQAAMLRGSLAGRDGRYIEQVVVQFHECVAAEQIVAAWWQTVEATEVLKGHFLMAEGEAVGFAVGGRAGEWRTETGEIEDEEAWLERDRGDSLPILEGVPWRVSFWEKQRRWVWTFHHALLDGRSITRIVQAFLARVAGRDPGGLLLPRWKEADAAAVEAARAFHLRETATPEVLRADFPDDEAAPAACSRVLGNVVAAGLEQAAERWGVTPATLVIWAWGQALAVAAGGECAAVGQVRCGAPQPGCAGFSMRTVPLLIPRARSGRIRDHVVALRARLLAMRSVEDVAVEDLPDLFANAPGEAWPGGVVMVETGTLHQRVGEFSEVESIHLHESGGGGLLASAFIHPDLRLGVDTDGVGVGPVGAGCLLDHWATMVERLAQDDAVDGDAAGLTQVARPLGADGMALEDGGAPLIWESIPRMWRESVLKFGGRPALQIEGDVMDYATLDHRARELAGRLLDEGVAAGESVASLLMDRSHFPMVVLALAMTGCVHVPLDPMIPEGRRRVMLADSEARFLIAGEGQGEIDGVARISPESGSAQADERVLTELGPGEVFALLYTSGSTGRPKGVKLTHGGVVNEAVAMARLLGLRAEDRVLQFASPGFDAALEEIFMTFFSGATLVPRPDGIADDLESFHQFICGAGITVLDLTTSFWAAWCAWMVEEKRKLPVAIRAVVVGGDRLSATAAADWKLAGGARIPLINSYGPTEASIVATAGILLDHAELGDPPIGGPLPGVIARVADASGARVPVGAAGELWLGGACVSPGYWQRPDRTKARFVELEDGRFYRTGDRVYRDFSGRLRFLGRIDQQMKIRGQRVEPEEVKRAVESYPGVGACHVGMFEGLLAAWVKWVEPPLAAWPGEVACHVSLILPAAAVPVRWAAVDGFPLTERGKLDTAALPPPVLTAVKSLEHEEPATDAEKRIAEIWRDLLGVERIGRDDSFFDLGGHSLAALRLFAIVSREWHVRVPMAALVQASTPRRLAEFLEVAAGGGAAPNREPVVVSIRAEGSLAPLFCIHGGDGGVIFYRNIALHLPAGRPLLAIESPALGADEEVRVVPVEESARDYVRAMRKQQPSGPYYLAGYSFGGLLAYEMAVQLLAAGEEVAFVALFDTVNPAAPVREYRLMERVEVYWNSQQRHHWFDRILRMAARVREGVATHLRVKSEIRAARTAGATEPHSQIRMLQVREAHWAAMEAYRPPRLGCKVTLFRTRVKDDKYEIPADYGWGAMVDCLEILEVGGKHLTMFEPRHAADLARKLASRIEIDPASGADRPTGPERG